MRIDSECSSWSSFLVLFVQEFESLEVLEELRRVEGLRLDPWLRWRNLSLSQKCNSLTGPSPDNETSLNAAEIYARVRGFDAMVLL